MSSFSKKRDRIEVLAEILGLCRSPQTQTFIRRQTSVSYGVLQSCIMYLRMQKWLVEVNGEDKQKKLVTTEKGMVFFEKWAKLQRLAGMQSKCLFPLAMCGYQTVKVVCR